MTIEKQETTLETSKINDVLTTSYSYTTLSKKIALGALKMKNILERGNLQTIGSLSKIIGIENFVEYVEIWVAKLNLYIFNDKSKGMSEEQITEVSIQIIRNYYYLSVPEMALAFDLIKKGVVGKVYGEIGLNPIYILNGFDLFLKERKKAIELKEKELAKKRIDERISNEDCIPMPDFVKKSIEKLEKSIKKT